MNHWIHTRVRCSFLSLLPSLSTSCPKSNICRAKCWRDDWMNHETSQSKFFKISSHSDFMFLPRIKKSTPGIRNEGIDSPWLIDSFLRFLSLSELIRKRLHPFPRWHPFIDPQMQLMSSMRRLPLTPQVRANEWVGPRLNSSTRARGERKNFVIPKCQNGGLLECTSP